MSGHPYTMVKMSELALGMVSPWNYHRMGRSGVRSAKGIK